MEGKKVIGVEPYDGISAFIRRNIREFALSLRTQQEGSCLQARKRNLGQEPISQ